MSGSAIITDQIISVSTQRAPNAPPHPTITPSCYLLPSGKNVVLFIIDEINLEEIPPLLISGDRQSDGCSQNKHR